MKRTIKMRAGNLCIPLQTTETRKAEDGSEIIRIALSSESPVAREEGVEVLDHNTRSIDLTYLKRGAAFLVNHNQSDQIGVLENVSVDADKVVRADVRFSDSTRAQEIMRDMKRGIRPHISVGYVARKARVVRNSDGPDTYRVVDWMPFEASTVAVPADPSVGVWRSSVFPDEMDVEVVDDESTEVTEVVTEATTDERAQKYTTENVTVSQSTSITTVDDDGTVVREESYAVASHSVQTSEQTDEVKNEEVAEVRSSEETSETTETERVTPVVSVVSDNSETRSTILENPRMDKPITTITLSEKEIREFNVTRALGQLVQGKRSGLEFELSDDFAKRAGVETQGLYLPMGLSKRALSSTGEGAELIFAKAGDRILDALTAQTTVVPMGATVLSGLTQPLQLPRTVTGMSASWVSEGTTSDNGDLAFDNVSLTPKGLVASTVVNKQTLVQANYDVNGWILGNVFGQFGRAVDRAVLRGSGSNQPTGIYYNADVNAISGVSGSSATFAHMVSLETAVAEQNGLMGSGTSGYIITSGLNGYFKTKTKDSSGAGGFVLQDGEINGYRAMYSNQLPSTTTVDHTAIFGDFSKVLIGEFGAMEFIVDPYSAKRAMQVEISANWLVDVQLEQPKCFAVIKQIKSV